MNNAELLRPILNDRTRSVNFFNGRLLSAEDLTSEQASQRDHDALLGNAIGPGIVNGFEVEQDFASSPQAATVLVRQGLALNTRGDLLLLSEDVRLSLRPPAKSLTAAETFFVTCEPPQSGIYVSGEALYVLTASPSTAAQGRAPVTGLGSQATPCQAAYRAEGVKFRLVELPISTAELGVGDVLRNRVAGACLGIDGLRASVTDPFGLPADTGLIEQMRSAEQLTACEIPLAVLHWSSSLGIRFVDMYSVRRRPPGSASDILGLLNGITSAREDALGLQFQDQVDWLRTRNLLRTARARQFFDFLPAAGLLPVATPSWPDGAEFTTFFDGITYNSPTFVEGARLRIILDQVKEYLPIDLASGELVRLHPIRQNRQLLDRNGPGAARPYLLFVTGFAPDFSDPHYNVSRVEYSNFW